MTKEIGEKIVNYILIDSHDVIDKRLFSCKSRSEIYDFHIENIQNTIEGTNTELIEKVIKILKKENSRSDIDYSGALYDLIGYKALPKDVYSKALREFVNVFRVKYGNVCRAIEKKIDQEQIAISVIDDREVELISKMSGKKSFQKDISESEKHLRECYWNKKKKNSNVDTLNAFREYLKSVMNGFADLDDKVELINKIRLESVKCSIGRRTVDDIYGYYSEIIDNTERNVQDTDYLFFIVKLIPVLDKISNEFCANQFIEEEERELVLKNRLDSLPKVSELIDYKNLDKEAYLRILRGFIGQHNLVDLIKENISSSITLSKREKVLNDIISLFDAGNYELFINILPVQIEGIFQDLLSDVTTFRRHATLKMYQGKLLKEKINILNDFIFNKSPEGFIYFGTTFNNIVRNTIAHGSYHYFGNDIDDIEVTALELLLDFNYLLHLVKLTSEIERMQTFINNYVSNVRKIIKRNNPHYSVLLSDLNGSRLHYTLSSFYYPEPIELIYWIFNPYYENLYLKKNESADLLELRNTLKSREFWEFVHSELSDLEKREFIKIHDSFRSIIRGLFSCGVSEGTKRSMAKVLSIL